MLLLGPPKPPRSPSPLSLPGDAPETVDLTDFTPEGGSLVTADDRGAEGEEEGQVGAPAETEDVDCLPIKNVEPKTSVATVAHPADELSPSDYEVPVFCFEERRASMPVVAVERASSEDDPRRSSEPHPRLKWPHLVEIARRRGRQNHDLRRQIVERRSGSRSPFRGPGRESEEPGSVGESGGPGSPRSPRSGSSSSGPSRSSSRGRVKQHGESDSETDSESFGRAVFRKLTVAAGRKHRNSIASQQLERATEEEGDTTGKSAGFPVNRCLNSVRGSGGRNSVAMGK